MYLSINSASSSSASQTFLISQSILGARSLETMRAFYMFIFASILVNAQKGSCALTAKVHREIAEANRKGPYLGLVIPNLFKLSPLLQSSNFTPTNKTIDFAGKRFRFGIIGEKQVILVMTGLGMINAAITSQLLLSFFKIEGVIHYGIAGNANPSLNIGDVAIPQYWAHSALWNWQRYGKGAEDELALESNGDYTREIRYLKFANYTRINVSDSSPTSFSSYNNLLNNIWYQSEEVFPINGIPEERQHAFWVTVSSHYFNISQKLKDLQLEGCLNTTTCLSKTPTVVSVERGTSGSIYLDNAAYRSFIYQKFNVSPVDMESASVALICLQQNVPFIAFRALSDLAGGGSAQSNEADTFLPLAATNSVTVVLEFIKLLS
ncbi:Bark storage protein A [Quillaja saponaria]|uniref:Bark storage protein A n=1 Tax=Quillaja saponaria TaxID=32244 RepID=A0AAD7LX85_QUISA|nr:Bark storage protein A [Quillaja saponaria]